jgi:hypothetical protein
LLPCNPLRLDSQYYKRVKMRTGAPAYPSLDASHPGLDLHCDSLSPLSHGNHGLLHGFGPLLQLHLFFRTSPLLQTNTPLPFIQLRSDSQYYKRVKMKLHGDHLCLL